MRVRTCGLFGVIAALHAAAFGVLILVVAPHHYAVGKQVFGLGLGITAYTLGMRHAFDADHIAAIDNTTRKLMADGKRPLSSGLWFALGHSSVVVILAVLIAGGARLATTLTSGRSAAHHALELAGTGVAGLFLYLIAALNAIALAGIIAVFTAMRRGEFDEEALEAKLNARGFFNRLLSVLTRSITRPGQMFVVGLLFGVGFDTATEVTLLVLAGSGAASGLPWQAIVCLPLLFAAGMSLFDTLDGAFMSMAYRWAFSSPVRKVYYNMTITALSVAVAFVIGTIELVSVLHDRFGVHGPIADRIATLDLNSAGFVIVALFAGVWAIALAYWRIARVEHRWAPAPGAANRDGPT
ncbi:MAG: HoxN/HupN/NixA family nickel/cobalt transporter [Micromonosporaceae bacterium]